MLEPIDAAAVQVATDVREVRNLGPIGSTNTAMREALCKSDVAMPAVFFSEEQQAGRGRFGRQWTARPGDLTFSIALDSAGMPSLGVVALGVGRCVAESLASCGLRQALVKWPNDVVLFRGGRLLKLAGILIEPVDESLVVGVGINVAARREQGRTSLVDEQLHDVDRTALLGRVVTAVLQLRSEPPESILERTGRRDALRGRRVDVEADGTTTTGVAAGFAPDGGLELSDGRVICTGSVRLAGAD